MSVLYTQPFTPDGQTEPLNFDPEKYFYFSGDVRLKSEYRWSVNFKDGVKHYGIVSTLSDNRSGQVLGAYEPATSWIVNNNQVTAEELETVLNELGFNKGGAGSGSGAKVNYGTKIPTDTSSYKVGDYFVIMSDGTKEEDVIASYLWNGKNFIEVKKYAGRTFDLNDTEKASWISGLSYNTNANPFVTQIAGIAEIGAISQIFALGSNLQAIINGTARLEFWRNGVQATNITYSWTNVGTSATNLPILITTPIGFTAGNYTVKFFKTQSTTIAFSEVPLKFAIGVEQVITSASWNKYSADTVNAPITDIVISDNLINIQSTVNTGVGAWYIAELGIDIPAYQDFIIRFKYKAVHSINNYQTTFYPYLQSYIGFRNKNNSVAFINDILAGTSQVNTSVCNANSYNPNYSESIIIGGATTNIKQIQKGQDISCVVDIIRQGEYWYFSEMRSDNTTYRNLFISPAADVMVLKILKDKPAMTPNYNNGYLNVEIQNLKFY